MVVAQIYNIDLAENLLKTAFSLAEKLKKEFGVLYYAARDESPEPILRYLCKNGFENARLMIETHPESLLAEDCERREVSFLLIQWADNRNKLLKKHLQYCRNLRIPYIFFKDTFTELNLNDVLVPVGFLVEEYEKAQFASAFGRFCGSVITVLLANDYGSKAVATAEKMEQIFDKFNLDYRRERAKSDSFKLDKEAVKKADVRNYGIVLISTSRDYGLDDMLFGSKEYHLLKQSTVPLLLVNPRGDLYTLCD